MTQVQITLEEDDAIILFEILNSLSDDRRADVASEPEFESIDALVCAFESVLVAPFNADYADRDEQILTQRQRLSQSDENQ